MAFCRRAADARDTFGDCRACAGHSRGGKYPGASGLARVRDGARRGERGGGAPEAALLRDWPMLALIALWVGACAAILW